MSLVSVPRELYPPIEPYETGFFEPPTNPGDVQHKIYYEVCGNPAGKPVVFLHGGPGSGASGTFEHGAGRGSICGG